MSFSQELSMVPRLSLEVSPALVSFAELLMLPYAAMQSVVDEQLCDNAALERLDAGECPICEGMWTSRCPICSAAPGGRSDRTRVRMTDPMDSGAVESDAEALLGAVLPEVDVADASIAEYLVNSLDRHGLLDESCAELAAELGVDEPVVARLVDVMRRVGPPGVAARSVEECLLLQLDALALDDACAALAREVITAHLPALAKGHFGSIARALHVEPVEIKQVLELIRCRLRPYPAFDGDLPSAATFVVPDVIVRHRDDVEGEFLVDLVEPTVTRLGVRRIRKCDAESSAGSSVPQARSFLALLGDRWETLRRVAEFAVARQKGFLLEGDSALKPLTRAEVATELDLHESTVSRTVAGKYVLLPDRSVVPLSRFFTASGGLDGTLRMLVDAADGPVSDQRLAELLRDAGYPIARRTVAKHRTRLGITSASMR